MNWLLEDTRFGLRTILKDRGFFVTAVLALALGIGSTTAIFSVIDNVLLEPFPYTDGQRLMAIQIREKADGDPQDGREFFSVPEFLDYQEQNHIFDQSIGIRQDGVLMTGSGAPVSFRAGTVTGNTFAFLGVPPLLGRPITPADARAGAAPVFVLSYKVWRSRFGGDPNILGKTFIMNEQPTTLVGIMPKRFAWWGADLWVPTSLSRAENGPNDRFFCLLGRLKPGLTPESAQPDVAVIAQRLAKVYPRNYPKQFAVRLQSLVDNVVGKFRTTLYTLLAAVGLLLLIACANVGNLLLARATAREKEFAVRSTLGAGRFRIVRQLMVESVLLALAGAAAGCLFAWAGLRGLVAILPAFTFPDEALITLNVPVLLATLAAALLTALLFGLAPALGASRRDQNDSLKAGGRGNSGFRKGRLRNVLIVSEVALSLILLTGAGLLMRSFFVQRQVDLGFTKEHVLTTQIQLPAKQYKSTDQQSHFALQLLPRLANLPGVEAASLAVAFPPFGGINTDFEVAGKTHSEKWKGQMVLCSPEFFSTLRIRLLNGRLLTEQDASGKRKVLTINQAFAAKYFPGEDPIGKRVKLSALESAPEPLPDPWFEIVGVTSDIKNHGIRDPIVPEVYAPHTFARYGFYAVFLRTTGNPSTVAKAMDEQIWAVDRNIVPQQTSSLEDSLDLFEYAQPRFGLRLFSVFASIGLILVSVGVYSVISYTVSQQSHEIGIRMALGATTGDVRSLVLKTGLRFIAFGMAIGTVLAFMIARILASQFWGVSPYDPATLTSVVVVLTLVSLGACYVPSRRATRVDPAISLRYD